MSSSESKPASTEINGVILSGPADKLEAILATVREQQEQEAAGEHPAIDEGRVPNVRHSGVHELLRLQEAGELKSKYGLELSREEEEGLRTYGRSGPAVDTVEKAIEVVLQWREWEIKDRLKSLRR